MWLIFYDDDKTCGGAPLWIHGALNLFFLFFQKKSPIGRSLCTLCLTDSLSTVLGLLASKTWLSKANYKYPKIKPKSNKKLIESKYSQKFLVYWETKPNKKKIKSKPNVTQIPKYKSIQPNFSKLIHILYPDLRKKKKLTSGSSLSMSVSQILRAPLGYKCRFQ